MNLFYLSTHIISYKMRKKRNNGKRTGKLKAPGMHLKTQNTEAFCDADRTKQIEVVLSDGQDDVVFQLYNEYEENEIDNFLRGKIPEWSLEYFDSQVESYELLASGFEDYARIKWIKNIYYVLQKYLARGASKYDTYIRSQWKSACRLQLMPAWSGDSVEEFHFHLRR